MAGTASIKDKLARAASLANGCRQGAHPTGPPAPRPRSSSAPPGAGAEADLPCHLDDAESLRRRRPPTETREAGHAPA